MESIQWKEKYFNDESIEKIDYHEYCPNSTNLNQAHADIRLIIQNQDQFILPHKSYIYLECKLEKEAGTAYAVDDDITLVNNGLCYLFERISYEINGKEIEGYSNVGVATTMKGLVTYSADYNEGSLFLWKKDVGKGINNTGFKNRKKIIFQKNNTGNFSAIIPLKHLFGFCENYRKIMYGLQHTLILRRNYDDEAIIKSDDKEDGADKIDDGKVTVLKLSWYMPHVTLNDEAKLSLMKDIKNKTSIDIGFLNRQCERYNIVKGTKEIDWRLNIAAGSEKPRYILVGIQETSEKQQTSNGAIFSHFNYRNAFVQLNNERYPEHDLRVNYDMNNFIQPYKMVVDYFEEVLGKEQLPFGLNAFESLFPILLFDTSNQSEKLKSSPIDIRVKVSFSKVIDKEAIAYALVLSDRFIKLESDGNKMNIVY